MVGQDPPYIVGTDVAEANTKPYAAVALNVPLDGTFQYRIPPALSGAIERGARVRVSFGRRQMVGYVVGFEDTPAIEESRIKPITELVDRPPMLDERMLEMSRWMAAYYCCSWGEALDAVLPGAVKKKTTSATIMLVSAAREPAELRAYADEVATRAPRQARALRTLASTEGEMAAKDLVLLAEIDYSVLRTLEENGYVSLRKEKVQDDPTLQFGVEHKDPPVLTDDQVNAMTRIGAALDEDAFKVLLLHGVTGSGKTELYLQALERVVAAGRQGIVLVPEIALTPQTVARFKARFDNVCVLHSELTDRGRREQWKRIRAGKADVVIGARSAIFAPVPKLGLLVVDEEHETSFKQQNAPRYHGRDVGIWRARQEGALVILGSATPSLESLHNARSGKYELVELPSRVSGRPMPHVEALNLADDLTKRGHSRFLSRKLMLAIEDVLSRDEQVILFLNRRGFNTNVSCERCGFVLTCKDCDVSMTYHRTAHAARCHYCGHEVAAPKSCPGCNAPKLSYRGTGTQRVEDEIAKLFGEENVTRMDSDAMRGWGAYEEALSNFREGRTKILLGTQMVAKGLDFPNVTLVGVINADVSLNMPDFRASERAFQLLMQVSGRAGRGERPGRVIVQTFSPDHPAIQFAMRHDFHGFMELELADRRDFDYPPYGRLARILAEGTDKNAVEDRLEAIVAKVRQSVNPEQVRVLGPAEAPIARIKTRYRRHAVIKAPKVTLLQQALRAVDRGRTKGVTITVDVDPVALL
jgi:primosomal protein N' (replication factor Y) (superfamily II helicase)